MDGQSARRLFVLANAFKEGDMAVGGTTDDRIRQDARRQLLATTIGDIRRTVFVGDALSEALERSRDRRADSDLDALTVSRLKRHAARAGRSCLGARASSCPAERSDRGRGQGHDHGRTVVSGALDR